MAEPLAWTLAMSSVLGALPPLATELPAQTPLRLDRGDSLSIGTLDGRGETVLGQVTAVADAGDGRLLVLDAAYHKLRLFDGGGRHLSSTGRPGRGPGELAHPVALGVRGGRDVYVLDRLNARVARYRILGDTLTHVDGFRLSHPAQTLCLVDSGVIIVGEMEGRLVHHYMFDGSLVRSYGHTFRPETFVLTSPTWTLSQVACDPDGRVFIASEQRGLVRAYTIDGELQWQTSLSPFDEAPTWETPGRIHTQVPEEGAEYVTGVLPWGEGFVAVQVDRYFPFRQGEEAASDVSEDRHVRTFLLERASGRVAEVMKGIPKLSYLSPARAVSVREDPYPRVVLWRRR